jgi:hypothetical protein
MAMRIIVRVAFLFRTREVIFRFRFGAIHGAEQSQDHRQAEARRLRARIGQRLASQASQGRSDDHVPHPKKDLPIGTALAIAKQAGWV